MGCEGDCCLGHAGPLGRPVALALALSRGAGEGTVVLLFGLRGDGGLGCWTLTLGGIGACYAEQSGYGRCVDGELVERVVDVVWVGDCDWNSPERTLTGPVGVLEWD